MIALAPVDAPVLLTRDLRRLGMHDGAIRTAVRAGQLVRLAKGAYTSAARWTRLASFERYRLRCRAQSLASRAPVVLSHHSAASTLGLPLVAVDLSLVHYTVAAPGGTKTTGTVRRHALFLPSHHVTTVDGISVTSPARTLADLGATCAFATAVVALDAALALRLVTLDDVRRAADERGVRRGRRSLERALEFADARSGSPGESLSRARMHELGFPAPVLQQPWRMQDGRTVYTDFWWPAWNLIGEFDGVAKYVRDEFRNGQTPAEVVVAEKKREDALRAMGPRMTRWTWETANSPPSLLAHLTGAGLPASAALAPPTTP